MNNLQQATDEFIRVISDPSASNEDVNASLQPCFKFLSASNEEEVNTFLKKVMALASLPDMERGALAATVCGYLVENGFPSEVALIDFINFFDGLLDKSLPFFNILSAHISKVRIAEEERDEAVNRIYSELLNDQDIIDNDTYNAVLALDKFYACGISLFSINKDNLTKAKTRLGEKVSFVADYSEGVFWINKLFSVLFDEPVVVIDIDNHIGFEGTINGIVDNYQLQHLLMGLPLLNGGIPSISDENLAIANGTGPQTSDNTVESKWNMYHYRLCAQPDWRSLINNGKESARFRESWIWPEALPVDIAVCQGCRVILLGSSSYSRSSRAQRTFKNLKASISVDKVLLDSDIDKWLRDSL